jgi:short-subunit dehydrogenase
MRRILVEHAPAAGAQVKRSANPVRVTLTDVASLSNHDPAEVLALDAAIRCLTRAFLPLLKRSRGSIVNHLSLAALAPVPIIPGYSISKAASSSMTQSLRALLAGEGVAVHDVYLGPVDTDMNRGLNIPKASTETAAKGILDGLENREEEIFPDPASRPLAEGWRTGVVKALEREFAAFVPRSGEAAA